MKEKHEKKYIEAVGRRKTAVARVRLSQGKPSFHVNDKGFDQYFTLPRLRELALASLKNLKMEDKFIMTAKVVGGGVKAQAEAIRHGIARALVKHDAELKTRLRGEGFLTRDPRMVERKKYGLKKARRAPQWAKR